MSQQYETGHAKNVANFQKLIEQSSVYTAYNPSVENLKIESLKKVYAAALKSITEVHEKRNANKNTIHARQQAYDALKHTCTRIINHLEILSLPSGDLDQAKSLNRLIQGRKKRKEEDPVALKEDQDANAIEKKKVSTSRQSYTQLATNFSKLLQLLATIPTYAPNTEELKLETLQTYLKLLVDSTKNVDKTEATLNNKLIERNHILYAESTGLYVTAQNVKKYIKSLYGASSEEYSKVSRIKFTFKL